MPTNIKTLVPKFSYDSWAKEMDFRGKTYLRVAVLGRRKISETLAEARQPQQKKLLGRKLTDSLREDLKFQSVKIKDDLLSDPLVMAIRNFLSFQDVSCTERVLVMIFGPCKDAA